MLGGMFAAVATFSMSQPTDDPVKTTLNDLRNIGVAIEEYAVDENSCPAGHTGSVKDLNNEFFVPFYIKKLPMKDGWGNELRYLESGAFTDAYSYSVISYGADGLPDELPASSDWETTDPNADIIFSNGQFTRAPKMNEQPVGRASNSEVHVTKAE